jgi:glyoxylase-like metal-dependent hydrolase (beta-lactamase superfamily II)
VGETTWEALHCPGHTLGHIVYYNRENKFAQVGDVIFKNSMGRYTLWGGCRAELVNSIWKKLFPLGDVNFVAGHREESNLKKERETNWAVGDRAQRGLMMPFALYLDVFDIAFRGPGRLIEAWRWSRMNRCNM